MKKILKSFFKNNIFLHKILVNIVFIYLKLVYFTNKWEFVWPDGLSEEKINEKDGVLFIMWHNHLAFSMYACGNYNDIYGLASPHRDGKIITEIVRKMGYKIIEGSTNRDAFKATKSIIDKLKQGSKILITPDGPRGPARKINSSVARIGFKYGKDIIPVSCAATKYFRLKSWDKMIIPKLFGKIVVTVGAPAKLIGDVDKDDKFLEGQLNVLAAKAESIIESGAS